MAAQHGPVGMVGTGNMGGRMTRRMVEAGYDVLAVDADPARIPACGAVPAKDLAELAARCDVIMLSLPDSAVIETVIRGPNGLLEHARDGQVVVDLSTADPASTRALRHQLAARGVRYLDAGISGGAAGAEQGTLTLMVGGDAAALARVRPLLGTFSAHVHHMGGSGAGHVTKVLNNFLNGVTLAATAEVMVAGQKAGLDLAQLLEVINSSSGVSYDFWTGPMGRRGQFAHSTEASELDHLRGLREAGRLTLAGRTRQVAPGIELTQVGGPTPGQAIVSVATAEGPVVLASDAVHYYEELERDRPFSIVASLEDMYAAFDRIRAMGEAGARVVAGHDPLVAERFGGSGDVILIAR
jgi:3-hydroxyisobutyrate dehydrogenase